MSMVFYFRLTFDRTNYCFTTIWMFKKQLDWPDTIKLDSFALFNRLNVSLNGSDHILYLWAIPSTHRYADCNSIFWFKRSFYGELSRLRQGRVVCITHPASICQFKGIPKKRTNVPTTFFVSVTPIVKSIWCISKSS